MPKEIWECQTTGACDNVLRLGEYRYCQKPSLGCRYAVCLTDEKKVASAIAAMREKLVNDLARWLDAHAIAKAIVDRMEVEEIEVTLEGAKKVWASFLECEIRDGLESRIEELLDNEELKPAEEETPPAKRSGPRDPLF